MGVIALAAVATAASAQELRLGLGSAITSRDPHFHLIGSNSASARNVFDALVNQDDRQRIESDLATTWRAVDATSCEFRLREGVLFHDSTPFTAEDVAASLRRVPNVRNSQSGFLPFVRPVTGVEVVDMRAPCGSAPPRCSRCCPIHPRSSHRDIPWT